MRNHAESTVEVQEASAGHLFVLLSVVGMGVLVTLPAPTGARLAASTVVLVVMEAAVLYVVYGVLMWVARPPANRLLQRRPS